MALFRENAVIVVTGGTGGIGTVIVDRLKELGATAIPCDYGLDEPYGFDVRQRDGWRTMFAQVLSDHGRIDVLINNAGVQTQGTDTIADLEDDEWARVMDINVNGARLGMSEVIPHLLAAGGGRIINTASVSGYRHFPGAAVYSTSKASVIALTEQAALDYSPHGIYINAIAPGMMENTMKHGEPGSLREKVIESSLTGEAVKRVEIATAVEFLLDERISSVVGTTIHVDGGFALLKGR